MVYFVLRSQYHAPLGHRLVTFEDETLLSWFQSHWVGNNKGPWRTCPDIPDILPARPVAEWEEEEFNLIMDQYEMSTFGMDIYGFWAVWEAMQSHPTAPTSYEDLHSILSKIEYPEGDFSIQNHALEAVTDDDEIEIAWYFFDDWYLERHPERVQFLLRDHWELPGNASEEGASLPSDLSRPLHQELIAAAGTTYCALFSAVDGMTIMDITGCYRFDDGRLPDFADRLRDQDVPMITEEWQGADQRPHRFRKPAWPEELVLLRAFLFDHPDKSLGDALQASAADELYDRISSPRDISDFRCAGNETVLTGNPSACQWDWQRFRAHRISQPVQSPWESTNRAPLIQNSDHITQIRFTVDSSCDGISQCHTWGYLFFDDLWAAAHPALAESILHYGRGWSVLA